VRAALVLWLGFAAAALSAEKPKDLEKTPQGKAYRALLAAVEATDFEAYKKCMTKASVEGIDKEVEESGLAAKEGMEMLKMMAPANLKLTGLSVDGEKATLEATGDFDGSATYGKVLLEREDGAWKVAGQSWKSKKE
jgi:hypothetical protein